MRSPPSGQGPPTCRMFAGELKKAKTFSILRFSCCYGSIAHNKLFSSKFDIWAPRSGFGEIPWTPSAHKLDHCTYLCTGRDPRSFARDTIILARHRHPHHHRVIRSRFRGPCSSSCLSFRSWQGCSGAEGEREITGRKTRKGEKRANSQKQEREASSRKTTRRQLMEGWLRRWWIPEI